MTNDCPLEMIMTLFLGAEPFLLDDSQIETAQPESRNEQGKIHPRQRRISKKWKFVQPFDSGCILPCGTFLLRAI